MLPFVTKFEEYLKKINPRERRVGRKRGREEDYKNPELEEGGGGEGGFKLGKR